MKAAVTEWKTTACFCRRRRQNANFVGRAAGGIRIFADVSRVNSMPLLTGGREMLPAAPFTLANHADR